MPQHLLHLLILLVTMRVTLVAAATDKQLIAAYSFENQLLPYSEICPLPAYLASPFVTEPGVVYGSGPTGYGNALSLNQNTMRSGGWSFGTESFTIAAWINFDPSWSGGDWEVVHKGLGVGTTSWALKVTDISLVEGMFIPGFMFVAQGSESFYTPLDSTGRTGGTWYHVVGVYNDNGLARLYVDGEQVSQRVVIGDSVFESAEDVLLGDLQFRGLIDDVRFYNYALTGRSILRLYEQTGTQTPPVLTMGPDVMVPVGEPAFLNASVTSQRPIQQLMWSLDAPCIVANFSTIDQLTTELTFIGAAFSTYSALLTAFDGVFCSTGKQLVTLDATLPGYDPTTSDYPSSGVLFVRMGSIGRLSITLTGVPPPRIRWQQQITLGSGLGRRSIDEDSFRMSWDPRGIPCNNTANITTNCDTWANVPNATDPTFMTRVADASLNGTRVRFQAVNQKGVFTSSPLTVIVGEATSDSSDDGTDVGVIVGPIVGVVGACLILCCLCMLLVAVLLVLVLRRRNRAHGFPGVEPDFEQIMFGEYLEPMFKVKSKHGASLEALESLLMKDQFELAMALTGTAHIDGQDKLAKALTYIYHDHRQCGEFLEACISKTLAGTLDAATMFRSNTTDTKVFKCYATLTASRYVWQILARFVWEIEHDARALDEEDEETGGRHSSLLIGKMEIDPSKMDEAADPKINTLTLWLTAQKIFSSITRSTHKMPKELADVLVFLHHEVAEKFSGEEYKAMGGFLFLRFICPSLLAPQMCGLLDEAPSPTAQRQFILLTKVLQNLSNNTLPGAKEEFMNKLNEFIHNNQDDLHKFYESILSAHSLSRADTEVPSVVKRNALAQVYNILVGAQGSVLSALAKDGFADGDPLIEELKALLDGAEPFAVLENS